MPDDETMEVPRADKVAEGSILYLDGVTVSFDGFKALRDLSLVLAPGELRTVIGPNGAGKTTMMDVITGKTKPDTGDVLFDGNVDLTAVDETRIANLGIGRKFQKPTVFEKLTVFENLELALKTSRRTFATLFFQLAAEQKASASTPCSTASAWPTRRAWSPARCRTARNSGSRSACC